jgi:hypothetical protein
VAPAQLRDLSDVRGHGETSGYLSLSSCAELIQNGRQEHRIGQVPEQVGPAQVGLADAVYCVDDSSRNVSVMAAS